MALRIGAKPENSFDNPLGLMSDCHRRIEKFLDQLIAIAAQARGGALAPLQREALEVALRYFASASPLHTSDEEASLFPRMRASNHPEAINAMKALEALEADHKQADLAHAEVDNLGRDWLKNGWLPKAETVRLQALLNELRETYRKHIALEDNEIFPLAGRLLEASAIEAVGREMAARRGVDYDHLPVNSRCADRRIHREILLQGSH